MSDSCPCDIAPMKIIYKVYAIHTMEDFIN